MHKVNAFILAAGMGERLRPLTQLFPKPLIPVLGQPLLWHILKKIEQTAAEQIGINTYYQSQLLQQWVTTTAPAITKPIQLFPEDPHLGSGGGLKNAASLLEQGDFVVYNGDIFSDFDLNAFIAYHQASSHIATFAIMQQAPVPQVKSNMLLNTGGQVIGVNAPWDTQAVSQSVAFAGVAVYSPQIFDFLPTGYSSVLAAWESAFKAGFTLGTWDIGAQSLWYDVGTPQAYAALVKTLLQDGQYVDATATLADDIELQGWMAIEQHAVIGSGTKLKNCIVLPNTEIAADSHWENAIMGPAVLVHIKPDSHKGRL
ncbi:MAG: sugar phosphate nucleotidyltransferase [Gammaproteobacteria bacterium]